MNAAALCALFGILCGDTVRDTPPSPPHVEIVKLEVVSGITKGQPMKSGFYVPDAFPSSCRCQPPKDLRRHFVAAARRHPGGPTACWLACQALCESDYRTDAVSPAGAGGIMQFVPRTAAELKIDPFDPREAIFGAARYDEWTRDRWTPPPYAGRTAYDIEGLGACGYNAGDGTCKKSQRKHGWDLYADAEQHIPEETRNYFRCIRNGGRG